MGQGKMSGCVEGLDEVRTHTRKPAEDRTGDVEVSSTCMHGVAACSRRVGHGSSKDAGGGGCSLSNAEQAGHRQVRLTLRGSTYVDLIFSCFSPM